MKRKKKKRKIEIKLEIEHLFQIAFNFPVVVFICYRIPLVCCVDYIAKVHEN